MEQTFLSFLFESYINYCYYQETQKGSARDVYFECLSVRAYT